MICSHVSPLLWISLPFWLLQSPEQSSLCSPVGSHSLSISHIAVCVCQSQSPHPQPSRDLCASISFVLCSIWQVKPVSLCFLFLLSSWSILKCSSRPSSFTLWMGANCEIARPHQHCSFQKKVLTGYAVPVCSVTEKVLTWPEINREGINLTHRFSLAWLLAALALGKGTHERQCFSNSLPMMGQQPSTTVIKLQIKIHIIKYT